MSKGVNYVLENKIKNEKIKKENEKQKITQSDKTNKEKKGIVIPATKMKEKWKSFSKKYSIPIYFAIGIPLFILAVLLTAQVKAISNTEELVQGKREAELKDELIVLKRNYDNLKEKYDANEKVVEEYQNNASNNSTLIASMKKQLDQLGVASGTTNVKGEGIIITLDDGDNNNPNSDEDSLVHDSYLLTVVNELEAAGAEAISINGQRIINGSAIRCVGPVIQVNYKKVAAPFEIKAIGNAQYLESAINIKNGIADILKRAGVKVDIRRESVVEIDKYDGTLNYQYVQSNEK